MDICQDNVLRVVYENPRVLRTIRVHQRTLVFAGVVFGGVIAILWWGIIRFGVPSVRVFNASNPGLGDVLIITGIWLCSILGIFRKIVTLCPVVVGVDSGVFVHDGWKRQFFIPWDDINFINPGHQTGLENLRGEYAFVCVKKGLPLFHLYLATIAKSRLTFRRGFRLLSSGRGYVEMIRFMKEHIKTC